MQADYVMLCISHVPIYCDGSPITEDGTCIPKEQTGKMRTRSCVALCIPLHLELLSH